jgi:hypothetical protein
MSPGDQSGGTEASGICANRESKPTTRSNATLDVLKVAPLLATPDIRASSHMLEPVFRVRRRSVACPWNCVVMVIASGESFLQ